MPEYDAQPETYDLIYSDYDEDLAFYLTEAKKANGAVLEAGCGTGRLLLKFLSSDIDAYGYDSSWKMLSQLSKNASAAGIPIKGRVRAADMRTFNSKRKFSLIIVPFRVFLHLLTSDDQLRALARMRASLSPGGRIIMNFFLPSPYFIAKNYGRTVSWKAYGAGHKKREGPANKRVNISDFTRFADEPNQIIRSTQSVFSNGKKIAQYEFSMSFIYKKEFELLLRLAGFSKWKVYGGFTKEKLLSSKQEMVWIIEK